MLIYKRFLHLSLGTVFLLTLVNCSRATAPGGGANFKLNVPKDGLFKTEASLVDRNICYAVNIAGTGITPVAGGACSPAMGLLVGFVAAGQSLSAVVPQGTDRKFELYALIKNPGEDASCPTVGTIFTAEQISRTYLVGTKEGVLLDRADPPPIEITVRFPGISQNVARTAGLNDCRTATTAGAPGFLFSSDARTVSGGDIVLRGRVGRGHDRQVLSGPGYKLRVQK